MALPNFFSQKNCINSLRSDLSGLKTYADALNACAASLNACWVGNTDKQYMMSSINRQMQAVNTQRQDVNWVQQTADFVLMKLNELGALTGFSQPHIPSLASIHFMGGCAAKTRIHIDTGAIRAAAKGLNNKRAYLVESKNHLASAVNLIDVFILGIWTIGAKITIANKQIDALLNQHDTIVAALHKIADIYDQADRRLNKKAGEVQSPNLLNPTPYSYLSPAVMELIKRVAKDVYDKIEQWLRPTGQEIKKEDAPTVVILNPQPKPETDADGFETIPSEKPEKPQQQSGAMKPYTDNAKLAGFSVVTGFSPAYLYRQYDYNKFIGSNGKNGGCTATAEAMAYSMYHQQAKTPDTMGWGAGGAQWNHSKVLLSKNTYTTKEAYRAMYNSVSAGKPVIFRVTGHELVAIGIRDGADPNNLTPADILVADPAQNKANCVRTLGDYLAKHSGKSLDTSWSLLVPKD